MNVYRQIDWLYQDLEGKPALLQYLPSSRNRVWRNSGVVVARYDPRLHGIMAETLQQELGWHDFRFLEAIL